jgi:hypothetical protein
MGHEMRQTVNLGVDDWTSVDRQLGDIARTRAELDAKEAALIREAERLQIWRELGYVSLVDYMERRLGYCPRAAYDRIRVARALADLPETNDTLSRGELSFSAVRELTRVIAPTTESAWLGATRGKNLRQIEKLVAGHKQGDLPTDPSDPDLRTRVLRFEVFPETYALIRQAHAAIDAEAGGRVDDTQFLAMLARGWLGDGGEARPMHQIAVTVCEQCKRGWQDGGGEAIDIGPDAIARACCDAQDIGSLDSAVPARATRTIPPAKRRLVFRRDHGRCRVPGCRSTRFLEIHHLWARADGGQHDVDQMILLCDGCHAALHRGTLIIEGHDQANLKFRRLHDAPAATSHGGSGMPVTHEGVGDADATVGSRNPPAASKLEAAVVRTQVRDALVKLGFKRAEAAAACDAAIAHVGTPSIDVLMREALRQCPKPAGFCVIDPLRPSTASANAI